MPVKSTGAITVAVPSAPPHVELPPSRSAQRVLAVFGVVLLGLLVFRGYGPRLASRPTEYHPAAIARQVDLNTADRAELLQVPGVGPVLADAILTQRRDRGRFAAVDDLHAVHGIGDRTLEKIRPWVTVPAPAATAAAEPPVERLERKSAASPAPVKSGKLRPGDPPLDVNSASEEELQRLPGIGPVMARKIIAARTAEPFKVPDDLRRVKGIGPKTMDRLRPLVACR